MAQIQSPETYADGQQVTAARLNNQTNGAILLPGAVTDQTAIAGGVASNDTLIVHDTSTSTLRKATTAELLSSGAPITTSAITAVAGSDLVITPSAGQKVDVAGFIEADSLATTGNAIIQGEAQCANLSVGGSATFTTNTAIKIPVGITADRPTTPVAGHLRYNSTLDQAEIYSGTEWKAVGGSPFDASGGVITTINGYKIHTFTVSGTFTPSLTKEGKVEVLVVGAGGVGASFNPGGGGGGGGDVKYGVVTIAKNTAPMTVVVGSGSTGTGGPSSFGSITANGGGPGSGYTGGTSGSGIAGGNGNSSGGGGGAGAQTTQTFKWTDAGGVGGQGYGSSISGTLRVYGGGGGGGGSGVGSGGNRTSAPGIYGGGGQGASPIANSGGGGSGSAQGVHGATLGADGIVIIRYRVS